jgi:hypothetical protein
LPCSRSFADTLGVRRLSILLLPCLACTGGPSGADAETDPTQASESETESETGEPVSLLRGEPTIVRHPRQPMVVDVVVELDAPGTGELLHTSDPGVGVFLLDPPAGEAGTTLHFRLRGLQPGTEHPLALSVHEAEGERSESWTGSLLTNQPLTGYLPAFQISTYGGEVDPDWRMFDTTPLFTEGASGVFFVDKVGTTRWYVGDTNFRGTVANLDDIWTGLRHRDDGTISYILRNAAYVLDELNEVQMQVNATSFGAPIRFHHDLAELPNGNFITLGYSFRDVEYEGEGTLHVAGDTLYEFTPAGELVWTWDSFDHLDPQRRRDGFYVPQKIPNLATGQNGHDWTHGNGIETRYGAEFDDGLILVSMRHQDWILAIDHETGEVVWRLGDEGDFTLVDSEYWFFHQHSPQWQPDGSLLLFDNAVGNPERPDSEAHSRAVRYALDFDAMTATLVWADDDPKSTTVLGGDADRTSGGHVLRLDSSYTDEHTTQLSARLRELDPERTPNAVWNLALPPGRLAYRAVPTTRWIGQPVP